MPPPPPSVGFLGSWKPLCAAAPLPCHCSTGWAEGLLAWCFGCLSSSPGPTPGGGCWPRFPELFSMKELKQLLSVTNTFPSMIFISSSSNWKNHAKGKRSWKRGGVGCGVQLCVCHWAPGCVWLCARLWSEVEENESHKSHTVVHGASLEIQSEDYSWTLPVHSLFNPLIDDSGKKMTAAHPWWGGRFHLFVYYRCTIYLVESEWWEVIHASWFKMLL